MIRWIWLAEGWDLGVVGCVDGYSGRECWGNLIDL